MTWAVTVTANWPGPYAWVVARRDGVARLAGMVRTVPSPKSTVQRVIRTEFRMTYALISSPIASSQSPVSAAVTVRTVPAGAVTGSTATPRSRRMSPEAWRRIPMPGLVRLVITIVGLKGFTVLPEQVCTVTNHSSRTGVVKIVA